MEEEVSVLATLLESVGTVISNFMVWFGSVTTGLISNPLIQLMFGMLIAILIYKLCVQLVGKAGFKKRGRRR